MQKNNINKFISLEFLLGVALGTGYLTSLRFLGPVGISEILILMVIISLFIKYKKKIMNFSFDFNGFIKFYTFTSIFLISPIITFIYYFMTDYASSPIYIISFIMGWLLCYLLIEAINNGFDMKKVTFWFTLIFIISNLLSIYLFGLGVSDESRYKGLANNPNQLLYYSASLTLMIFIYYKKISFFLIAIVVFIMLKTKSDAYFLTLFVMAFVYIYLIVFYKRNFSFKLNLYINFFILVMIVIYLTNEYLEDIINIWNTADQGGSRISLMKNALDVTFSSPLFGYGLGSFSGVFEPFDRWEAHNTFLDFSMQFGLIFPILIYYIFFKYFSVVLKEKKFLLAAFILSFIVSGFFHFTGRHFNFWVELAIFTSYIYYRKGK